MKNGPQDNPNRILFFDFVRMKNVFYERFMAAEDRQADHHGPHDRPHDVVREATEHLLNGRITSAPARKQLRDALDNADRAPVGPDWGRITRR